MAQSGRDQWVEFSKHKRSLVDVSSDKPPLPYGTGVPSRLRRTVTDLIEKHSCVNVLDLGCNAACWSPIFDGLIYYGLDQDSETLEKAMLNAPHGRFELGQGESLPYYDGLLDIVFTSHVLQHNDHFPEKDKIVREINRVLKPNGFFLMVECTPSSQEVSPNDQTFDKDGWISFVTERGFSFIKHDAPEEYLFKKKANS